eukprot:1188363-Prorocentrum_minimum.AAC.1
MEAPRRMMLAPTSAENNMKKSSMKYFVSGSLSCTTSSVYIAVPASIAPAAASTSSSSTGVVTKV